jgi:hypothetical protein
LSAGLGLGPGLRLSIILLRLRRRLLSNGKPVVGNDLQTH